MAIGPNDAIPTSGAGNIELIDIYMCYNKILPISSVNFQSLVNSYNSYWTPDKDPEFLSFSGVRVYKMTFPSFGPITDTPSGNETINITIEGGTAGVTYTFTTNLSLSTGPLGGEAIMRFRENTTNFCQSQLSFSGTGSNTDNTVINRTITVGSDTLSAYIEWNFESVSASNGATFNFTISPPPQSSSIIYRPDPASAFAFRTWETP